MATTHTTHDESGEEAEERTDHDDLEKPRTQTYHPEVEISPEVWAAIQAHAETRIQYGSDPHLAFWEAVDERVMLEPRLIVDGEEKGLSDLSGVDGE